MRAGDAVGNGQAQPAASHGRAVVLAAVEAAQRAGAFRRGDARAAVVHREHQGVPGRLQRHIHRAAPGGVLDGVVQQVAQQDGQRLALPRDVRRSGLRGQRLQPQVDAARIRGRRGVGHGALHPFGQQQGLGRAAGGPRLLARQGQQLLDQARGPVDAGGQALGGAGPGLVVTRARQRLRLQLQGGQRRAQLMRRIGHEVLLRIERLLHARQQQVELIHQRAHLGRQALRVHAGEVVGAPLGHLAAHALHGRQRAAHRPPGGQRQQRRHQGNGPGGAQRQLARQRAAHGHVLRHLDDLQRRLHRQHAVGAPTRLHVGKAQHRALRQAQAQVGLEHPQAVGRPDLEHEFMAFLARHQRIAVLAPRPRGQAGAQRLGGLLHLAVEQGVSLVHCSAPGQRRLHQHAQGNGAQQRQQQPRAQRVRDARRPQHAGAPPGTM